MNDTDYILTKVREAFRATFDINPQLVTMDTVADDVPGWDSVGHLSLGANLEQAFGISMDVDDLMEMESVRKIVLNIAKKLPKKT